MNTLEFLEQMAESAHYNGKLTQLIYKQPKTIVEAYKSNSNTLLRKYFGETEYIANPSDVVQL